MLRTLDLAVLRSFVLIAEGRSFAEAAELVGRSPSAISLQIQKLEGEIGSPVFRRSAREVALTLAGERLLGYAQRLIRLNDEAVLSFRAGPPRPLRFGVTQDFAEAALPPLLGRFAAEHPLVELTLKVDRSQALVEAVHAGTLDLAVALRRDDPLAREVLAEVPMLWIGAPGLAVPADRPVPLALFEAPCSFRSAALDALARAGRPGRVAFTRPSLSGLKAAAAAGIALTVRTRHLLTGNGLADLGSALGLPPLPPAVFCLYAGAAEAEPWPAREDLMMLCRRLL